MDSYLLAMILRMYAAGQDEKDRDPLQDPSVLTPESLHAVAIVYAFYQELMEAQGVSRIEDLVRLIKAAEKASVTRWSRAGRTAVGRAERELRAYVAQPGRKGFTAFG